MDREEKVVCKRGTEFAEKTFNRSKENAVKAILDSTEFLVICRTKTNGLATISTVSSPLTAIAVNAAIDEWNKELAKGLLEGVMASLLDSLKKEKTNDEKVD